MGRLRQDYHHKFQRGALVASSSRIWTNLSPEDNDRKCRAGGHVLDGKHHHGQLVYKLRASCWGATNHTTVLYNSRRAMITIVKQVSHMRKPSKWRHVTRKAYCCCPLSYTRNYKGGGHSGWFGLTNASLLDLLEKE